MESRSPVREWLQHVLAMQHVEVSSTDCDMFIEGCRWNLIGLGADGETETSFRIPDIDGFDEQQTI